VAAQLKGALGGVLPVEVAVAVAGGAFEGVEGALGARRHELAAAVERVAADSDGVVLEALFVVSLGGVWVGGGWWSGRRRKGVEGLVLEIHLVVLKGEMAEMKSDGA